MKSVIEFAAAVAILAVVIGLIVYFRSAKTVKQDTPAAFAQRPVKTREVVDLDQDVDSMSERELAALTRAAFANGSYQRAAEFANNLCQRSPDEDRYHFLRGEIAFASGDMDASVAAFDEAIRLNPTLEPRLWQRGLALYYAYRFAEGVEQFETHQTVNSQDVENAVWHLLCAARLTDLTEARKNLIRIERDGRVPMAQIYQMFAGSMEPKDVLSAANQRSPGPATGSSRHHLQLYYAHLYIGLYQELLGDKEASLESMKQAVEFNPLPDDNFMGRVAPVHVQLRTENQPVKNQPVK
jgi:lipoprotein NlpI